MAKDVTIRFRVDFGPKCSIGVGKVELLENIAKSGSLSQAAREMNMSYRRAWLLLADMNLSFEQPVALTATGGQGGGGVTLTTFGESLVSSYRSLESGLQPLAQAHLQNFSRYVKASRPKKLVSPSSIRRKSRPS